MFGRFIMVALLPTAAAAMFPRAGSMAFQKGLPSLTRPSVLSAGHRMMNARRGMMAMAANPKVNA